MMGTMSPIPGLSSAFLTSTLHYTKDLPHMYSRHSAGQAMSMASMQMSSSLNSGSTLWPLCVGHNPPTDVNNTVLGVFVRRT